MSRTVRDTSQRRENIIRLLKEKGSVQVNDLMKRFSVSGVTVRKDLQFLEKQGIATRSYGGAMLSTSTVFAIESPFEFKQQLYANDKLGVGKAASDLVVDGDSIIIDAGSTTLELAANLKSKKGITVVTNSHTIISKLALFEQVKLISLGGTFRRKSQSFFWEVRRRDLAKIIYR